MLRAFLSVSGIPATGLFSLEAVKNNIKNLLLTNRGERVFQPLIGLNLRQFLFEQLTPEVIFEIQNDIRDTMNLWLPFVNIENIIVNEDTTTPNTIQVKVDFSIQQVPNSLDSITVRID